MDFEALKSLGEGGAWITLAGVLIWVVKTLLAQIKLQQLQHRQERLSQETRHRSERDQFLDLHRKERAEWVEQENRRSDKLAEAIERSLRRGP